MSARAPAGVFLAAVALAAAGSAPVTAGGSTNIVDDDGHASIRGSI